ncbi:MAG: hypothetical protein ACLTEH_05595 [Clostridia bacterium]
MNGEKSEKEITILVSESPKKYDKDFLDTLANKRMEVTSKIVKRIFFERMNLEAQNMDL